ncbi:pirin family protein [Anaerosphaera multitolerans]|uniref:Pirin family protein n=1 Tax=Anaerosphaera multitolerans TaxID=2487351 RepID=A0A437S770_9FIRM|nr:pirin family protein [Anaerosphaera multitolerans]RVU54883.1 pirin family protein [Anaerosphaera multitolerans]
MQEKNILRKIKGSHAIDGAGVHLVRVLGPNTMYDFDPFLMLDSFDSKNPEDYIKGFPWHPHRGIETITYLAEGEIDHGDSLGNSGKILAGQSQWMTAGSGILHQEMPQPAERMLGLQFWLNLPKEEKMTTPKYFDITKDMVGVKEENGVVFRVIAGEYEGIKGVDSPHIKTNLYDVSLSENSEVKIKTKPGETSFIFLLDGDGYIAGEKVDAKTAVLLGEGDYITVKATEENPLRFIFAMAKPLGEPIAWGGPIVMNTRDELTQAFTELDNDTFIKENAK